MRGPWRHRGVTVERLATDTMVQRTRDPFGRDGFEEFVHATADRLYRSALLMCGDHHLAGSITQATYAKVYSHWSKVAAADSPLAYSRTILTRTFLSHRRLRRSVSSPWTHCPTGRPQVLTWRCGVDLLAALRQLPPRDRAVLVLRYWEDLSVERTAEILGIRDVGVPQPCGTGAGQAPGAASHAHPDRPTRPGRPHRRPCRDGSAQGRQAGGRERQHGAARRHAPAPRARPSAGVAAPRPWARRSPWSRPWQPGVGRGGRPAARRPRRSWRDLDGRAWPGRGRARCERAHRCRHICPAGPGADRRARRHPGAAHGRSGARHRGALPSSRRGVAGGGDRGAPWRHRHRRARPADPCRRAQPGDHGRGPLRLAPAAGAAPGEVSVFFLASKWGGALSAQEYVEWCPDDVDDCQVSTLSDGTVVKFVLAGPGRHPHRPVDPVPRRAARRRRRDRGQRRRRASRGRERAGAEPARDDAAARRRGGPPPAAPVGRDGNRRISSVADHDRSATLPRSGVVPRGGSSGPHRGKAAHGGPDRGLRGVRARHRSPHSLRSPGAVRRPSPGPGPRRDGLT